MINNKKIFEWLNPNGCWHRWRKYEVTGCQYGYIFSRKEIKCQKCSKSRRRNDNPVYTTEHGFFLLLSGIREKGFDWQLRGFKGGLRVKLWRPVRMYEKANYFYGDHQIDLYIALAEAVMELILKDGE